MCRLRDAKSRLATAAQEAGLAQDALKTAIRKRKRKRREKVRKKIGRKSDELGRDEMQAERGGLQAERGEGGTRRETRLEEVEMRRVATTAVSEQADNGIEDVAEKEEEGRGSARYWVVEEDEQLLKLRAEGLTDIEISKRMKRTKNAIRNRVRVLTLPHCRLPSAEEKEARSVLKTWDYPGMVTTALLLLPEKMGTIVQVREVVEQKFAGKLDWESQGGSHGTAPRWKIKLSKELTRHRFINKLGKRNGLTLYQLMETTQADVDVKSPSSGAKRRKMKKQLDYIKAFRK